MELKVGYVCDRGLSPKRPVNQDRFLAIPKRGLFAVFDGVGGQRAGEVASQTAAETIEEAFTHNSTDGASVELIRRAIDFANRDVFELAESDPAYKTMATTVALIHVDGNQVTVAHVGDSRVYRLEHGRFFRETVDHTDLNDDIRAGRAAGYRGAEPASRNIINRALGVESGVDVEIKSIEAAEGARFLLCSDGIYRHMSDEEIARVLAEHKDPQRAADELKRIVHQRGADDNLTAVVVQMGRARQTPIIAIDDGMSKHSAGAQGASASAVSNAPEGGGRIRVEFNRAFDERTRRLERKGGLDTIEAEDKAARSSVSRSLMYTLLVLVLVAAAFYAGLRASDFTWEGASNANANQASDPLRPGRDAFESGDYNLAAAEFESVLKREPTNARAHYWLGRARLERREYEMAVKSFEEAATLQHLMYDAYLQQAAAYEAMGEKSKAAAALLRYAEERRKQDGTINDKEDRR
ncbi:MAG TPA: protein phosphatase 2C domain-containing protein [Blastocatellia bacterium]|nr:protein phosphatase 2C domain-containing protein [Blastocatellia bacterium]